MPGPSTKRAAYETVRLKLARVRLESGHSVDAGLGLVTQSVADALEVDRVGVWFLEDRDRQIVCREQFIRASREHTSGTILRAQDFPTYMRALKERRAIVADDAQSHPTTCELTDAYLRPNRIGALLDAPIIRGGEVIGIVCHERLGDPRPWTQREIDFAGSAGDLVALLLEQGDRVELEAALKIQTEERLEKQKLDALGLFARSVAHDLNNVLAVFAAGASEMQDQGLAETAESMLTAVEAGKRLSDQLFMVGERGAAHVITDIGKSLRRLLSPLRSLATSRVRVELDVRGSSLLSPIQEGDLERMLFNLIANARDAILESAQCDTGRIDIVLRAAEDDDDLAPDFVVLELTDNGCGMDRKTRVHLFEPYFTTKAGGHGLGLASVYGIVTRAGGSIDVASTPGQGASFRVALPRAARV